ncbi:lytic transglycosylase [Salmonella enterica subsp. enterica serovar Newport]|nr:lytic transglycosylase [Salmonella enterica subsp. enterica serovar Newport]
MDAQVIQDFLIALGFKLDEQGAKKFTDTLSDISTKALALGGVVEGAALSIVYFTDQIAQGLDKVYWSSQRTGASAAGIKALGYAAVQAGSSAEAAQAGLERLAQFMRNNPGAEGFLNRMGIQTRDAGGQRLDMSAILMQAGDRLSQMPSWRSNQYAQMLGLDPQMLMAWKNGLGGYMAEYQEMMKKTGFNAKEATENSNKFVTSMLQLTGVVDLLKDKIGSNLAGGLAGEIDILRKQLLDNFPKIEGILTRIIKGILAIADVLTRMLFRGMQAVTQIIDWWHSLDAESKKLIDIFGLIGAAWYVLNSKFLLSPIGIVIALIAALALLYDDYMTWKEGGSSYFDWSQWSSQLDDAKKHVEEFRDGIDKLFKSVEKLLGIDPKTWSLQWDVNNLISQMGELGKMLGMIADLLNAINEGRWKDAYAIGKKLLKQGSDKPDALPAVTDSANKAAEWMKKHLGFDPRIIGKTIMGSSNPHPGIVYGNNIQPDIPGGEVVQHAQSARRRYPKGIRNNNPGNLRFAGQSGAMNDGSGFAAFDSPLEGLIALKNQLMRYFTGKTFGRKLQTIRDIISHYAPKNENDTDAYIQAVAAMMHISPDAALNLQNPQMMQALMNSIVQYENGRNPYSQAMLGQATGATLNQQNTYNIYGGNAREIGAEVEYRQLDANTAFMRKNQAKGG